MHYSNDQSGSLWFGRFTGTHSVSRKKAVVNFGDGTGYCIYDSSIQKYGLSHCHVFPVKPEGDPTRYLHLINGIPTDTPDEYLALRQMIDNSWYLSIFKFSFSQSIALYTIHRSKDHHPGTPGWEPIDTNYAYQLGHIDGHEIYILYYSIFGSQGRIHIGETKQGAPLPHILNIGNDDLNNVKGIVVHKMNASPEYMFCLYEKTNVMVGDELYCYLQNFATQLIEADDYGFNSPRFIGYQFLDPNEVAVVLKSSAQFNTIFTLTYSIVAEIAYIKNIVFDYVNLTASRNL